VYTVDLTRGLGDLSPTTVAADGAVVYSTTSNLYVTSSGTHATTLLHRFDITAAGRPDYLGTATVPGVLLDSYSMSDYAGHLRVVTTTVDAQGHTSTALYELDDATLRTVGHVGGLGRNEQVQAVRFLGDLGYVVTFRQVDPLYVLDLRNPSAPRVAAALTAPGYSTYLHPVGTGRLLGVGAALDANEPTALKLALLDVSHSAHPRLLDQIVRTDVWGGGQLDPHAFLYWPDSHIAVVPAQATNGTSRPGALVVRVDADRLHVLGMIHNPALLAGDSGISRALVVGNTLWTMSQDGLAVRDLSSLHQLGWIPFG
jgi:uncharacterized secreted protein with C-terminal beta-propeller domain